MSRSRSNAAEVIRQPPADLDDSGVGRGCLLVV